jgi:hypothetical protein
VDRTAEAERWLTLARAGEFERAWRVSDRLRAWARLNDAGVPRHVQQVWDGTPLDGRRVLVRCYHGLGDTLQFARFIPRLCAIAQSVTVWAQPELLPLLDTLRLPALEDARTSCCGVTLLALHDGAPDADYDVDIEIMELMYAFRASLASIPRDVPYLRPPRLAVAARSSRRRIGLVWRSGTWAPHRSIPFSALAPLLTRNGEDWISLQADSDADETHANLCSVRAQPPTELARVMTTLDLVVTVDSMPAHLAGALGVPVWTLLADDCDWRWLADREDSPWYPTMRLFRQKVPGAWDAVIQQVNRALDEPR